MPEGSRACEIFKHSLSSKTRALKAFLSMSTVPHVLKNLKFNVIIVANMVIMLMKVEVPVIIRNDKPSLSSLKILED